MSSLISKGYTPCEYIESSGAEYIDTGFKPNQDTRVIMDVKGYSITSNVWAFCARNSASSNNLGIFYYYAQSKKWAVDYSTSSNRQQFDGISSDERLYIDHNKNVTTINNVTINNTYTTFQPSYNLVLLACNTAGSISGHMKAYLYSCKIYDNGTLIRDFKPCRNTSGVYGLFDEVNDIFYTTPSGSFTGNVAETSIKLSQSFRRRLLLTSNNNGPVGYEKEYLTIEALEDGTIRCGNADADTYSNPVYYSKNGGEWIGSTKSQSISVVSGDRVRFKTVRAEGDPDIIFENTTRYNVYGNIMSLLYGDDFVGQTSMPVSAFSRVFRYSYVNDASNLILPSTTLSTHCYEYMFYGCTELTTAPELPATTLATSCYATMFYGCTNLTTAPELPATTLAYRCYETMFYGCTSLTTAPALPATTLAGYCYYGMFYGCTSLNYIKMLATDISATYCLNQWVSKVSSTGTFVKHPDMNSLPTGISGIPGGWTVLNSDGSPVTGGGSSGGESTTASISWAVQTGSWTEGSNSSAKDGKQFTSVSPGSSGSTRIRCTFSGVTSITFNCIYYGESNYDYLTVGALDSTCTRDSYGTTLKGTSHTQRDITFSCNSGTHYVEFCYSKYGSVDTSSDCAVVYVKSYS